ncbi:MAG: peptidoglycan recognition family protein [Bdellovibrionota bacterium]
MLTKLLTLLILLTAAPLHSQDCVNCLPGYNPAPILPVQPWPLELIPIQVPVYPRNSRASFCKRPVDMVDTIVLHHTATSSSASAQDINRMHLNEGTAADPWYMVAYSYLVGAAYPGDSRPANAVIEGRPLDIVGAHAGSNVFLPMTDTQRQIWDSGQVVCGRDGEEFSVNNTLVQNGRIKANVTTIGVSVIGNYSPRSISNPLGYNRSRPRLPSVGTIDMIARLSCQLQKKYPNMKSIKWHSQYHSTECPGTIKNVVGQIKTKAKGYGCDFN